MDDVRKLATVQQILDIQPIEGADRIEVATVEGWHVVISKRDNFKVGDKVVYIEIDSVVPENDTFAFMRERNFRVRTIKLRKQVSEGLIMPISIIKNKDYPVGTDVTKELGIVKYDPEAKSEEKEMTKTVNQTHGFKRFMMHFGWFRKLYFKRHPKPMYAFPDYVGKTDEPRIQNCVSQFEQWKKDKVVFDSSEKVDGCLSRRMNIRTNKGEMSMSKVIRNYKDLMVESYNEDTGLCEYKKIESVHKIKDSKEKCYRIGTAHRGKGNRKKFIECTGNHPFYSNGKWIRADQLKVGDSLLHYCLSPRPEVLQIALGILLGDGSINKRPGESQYFSVTFSHGYKQKAYFDYILDVLGDNIDKTSVAKYTTGYGSIGYRQTMKESLPLYHMILDYCMNENQKKYVTEKWCNALTPISLAFWYMDDGTLNNREDDRLSERIVISSNGFSLEENQRLQFALKNKFNVDCTIGDKEVYKGYSLLIDAENTKRFCSLIAPYVCDSMKYKLPKQYENQKCYFEGMHFKNSETAVETKVLSVEEFEPCHFGMMYDLTVEDNHNYFAQSILVHNCSSSFVLTSNDKYRVCCRNYGLREIAPTGKDYWEISKKYDIEPKIREIKKNYFNKHDTIAFQGEILGKKIQQDKYQLPEHIWKVYNLKVNGVKVPFDKMKEICDKYGFPTVDIIDNNFVIPENWTIDDMVNHAKGNSLLNPNIKREGLVFRSKDYTVSFKVINQDFLLKYHND